MTHTIKTILANSWYILKLFLMNIFSCSWENEIFDRMIMYFWRQLWATVDLNYHNYWFFKSELNNYALKITPPLSQSAACCVNKTITPNCLVAKTHGLNLLTQIIPFQLLFTPIIIIKIKTDFYQCILKSHKPLNQSTSLFIIKGVYVNRERKTGLNVRNSNNFDLELRVA